MTAHYNRLTGLAWTTGQDWHEQEFGERIGGWKHLSGPVVLQVQRLGAVAGDDHIEAILPWRKTVAQRKAIVAGHGDGLQGRRDRERDGYWSRLAHHESAVGCGFGDNVARVVSS